jgi:hypothetical protein
MNKTNTTPKSQLLIDASVKLLRGAFPSPNGGSGFKTARGHPPVDVPQRHVPRCSQQACSSTYKASLTMVLFWIYQSWRFDVSSNRRLSVGGGWRRPLVSASAANPRDSSVFFYPLGVYLQSFQDDYFCLVFSLVFTLFL